MKPYPYLTSEKILLFEKILFLTMAILAIVVLMADRKGDTKIPFKNVEKVKHGLMILPDLSENLQMDGAARPDLFVLGNHFPMNC